MPNKDQNGLTASPSALVTSFSEDRYSALSLFFGTNSEPLQQEVHEKSV